MPLHLSETQQLSNVDGVAVQNSGLTKILKVTYNQIRPQVNSRLSLRPRTHVEQTCRTERYQSCADTGGKQTALVLLYTQVVEQTKRLMVYNKRWFYFIYIFFNTEICSLGRTWLSTVTIIKGVVSQRFLLMSRITLLMERCYIRPAHTSHPALAT